MTITKIATITPKLVAILPLQEDSSVSSCGSVPPVAMSGDGESVVGPAVRGCVTTTPVKECKILGHCY